MEILEIFNYLKRVEGMAKIGLSYTENPYDQERYEKFKTSTHALLAQLTNFIFHIQQSLSTLRNSTPILRPKLMFVG
jgi:hypothetical protein